MHTVLVIGGYGFFGARISTALAGNASVRVLIGGRSKEKGQRLARTLGLADEQAVAIDASQPSLAATLRRLRVDTVVHTAGPFQNQQYAVARAAIEAGSHYIDLADARRFVVGIGALDASARSRGVTVISGASSVPALSSAVVERYLPEFERLHSIRIGISSGARAPGLATVRGVFGYAGRPIRQLRKGSWCTTYGWLDLERHRFPQPLGTRWLGSCAVPDLDLLPLRYPTVETVTFQAGFASGAGHWVVWSLARLAKAGLLPSMVPLAAPLFRLSRWLEPVVSDKGGMFVALEGVDNDGQPRRMTWNLIAEHNDGPFVPCGAAIVLASKLAAGEKLAAGAMACMGLVTVAEYLGSLRGLHIKEIVE